LANELLAVAGLSLAPALAHEQLPLARPSFVGWAQHGASRQHRTRPWRLGAAPPRPLGQRATDKEGKWANSFLGLTVPGAVRNGGSPRLCRSDEGNARKPHAAPVSSP
jgi:hypothetical protein